jgi:cytokinesis protein
VSKKSREKNTSLEEQHRRNEASMRRKAGNLNPLSSGALSPDSDTPKSPVSTGAMDDLLQKLRAAKPEARDQRDRRRRARLKDRHQVRVASGQKIPELGEGKGMLSPKSESNESESSNAVASPTDSHDIGDRAAAMLEGLTGGKEGGLSVRRRRESADSERERRRRRRQQAGSAKSEDGGVLSPTAAETIQEEEEEQAKRTSVASGDGDADSQGINTPVTIVSPPSPEQKRTDRELPTPPPE